MARYDVWSRPGTKGRYTRRDEALVPREAVHLAEELEGKGADVRVYDHETGARVGLIRLVRIALGEVSA